MTFNLPSFSIGNGLIELSALTTMIGSTIAEVFVLGNKGPAGLVWGTMSAFGTSSVVKACTSAASPGWFRQMIGLRTPASDGAIGMDLPLAPDFKVARMIRSGLKEALGVSCNSEDLNNATETSSNSREHHSCRDIYAFDHETRSMLEGLPATSAGNPLIVYTFHPYYPYMRNHNTSFQVMILSLSLIKYFEAYFLFTHGSAWLGLLSSIPFTFFFLAAICVEISQITSCRRPMDIDEHIDLIAGTLPTVTTVGGKRKVVLGAMKNSRASSWWKFIWIFGALLHMVSIIISFVLLGRQTQQVVLTWIALQVIWLILRIVISLLADDSNSIAGRPMVEHKPSALPPAMKLRVANLILAVAKLQIHSHPRGLTPYKNDSFAARQISTILPNNIREDYILPQEKIQTVELNIFAVIGDTVLSSAAWAMGSTLSPMDLYDSCIVVLNPPLSGIQPHRLIAIPAVRVKCLFQTDKDHSEDVERMFMPRGSSAGSEIKNGAEEWLYWIPCGPTQWLQFSSKELTTLGKRTAQVVNNTQMTEMLSVGKLLISLKEAEEVKSILHISRQATDYLLSVLH